MTNPIETTIETLNGTQISLGTTKAVTLTAFAAYGAFAAGRDVTRKVRQIRVDRKVKKAQAEKAAHAVTPEA